MGISTWDEKNKYGLALALGSGDVKMTEIAGAYSILANMGEKVELNPIWEIKNYLGEVIYQKIPETTKLLEPEYPFLINDVLSDDKARAPIFGARSKLQIDGKTVAVKTGTTNVLKDNWCIGWTPEVLVAVWVGNNDSTPMSWVASGVSGATPIWNKIMRAELEKYPNETWPVPTGIVKIKVCGREEYFVRGTESRVKCWLNPTIGPVNLPN